MRGAVSLNLHLATGVDIASYSFITANDVTARDPISWQLRKIDASGTATVLSSRIDVTVPLGRGSVFGPYSVYTPPSPPAMPPNAPPSIPPQPHAPGAAPTVVMFTFTDVHYDPGNLVASGLQLSRVTLYDAANQELVIANAYVQGGGTSPASQTALNLKASSAGCCDATCCDDTKWYDSSTVAPTVLIIELASNAEVVFYQFRTADDPDRRDPTSWTVSVRNTDGTYTLSTSVVDSTPPTARWTNYPMMGIYAPPSPPTPPPPPAGASSATATASNTADASCATASYAASRLLDLRVRVHGGARRM